MLRAGGGLVRGAGADGFVTADSATGEPPERPGPGRGRGRGSAGGRGSARQSAASEKAALLARIAALEAAMVAGSRPAPPPGMTAPPWQAGARPPQGSTAPDALDSLFGPARPVPSSAARAADTARARAAELLGAASLQRAPFPEAAGAHPTGRLAGRPAAAPLIGQLPGDLAERVLHGGADAANALRLLELQILTQLSAGAGHAARPTEDDPFSTYTEATGSQGATISRGSAAIHQLHRTVQQRPEQVVQVSMRPSTASSRRI